jgi:predicted double-glycine peptidase
MALLYSKASKESDLLEFPELRQLYDYDCGASASQSVLAYYGYTEREDKILKKLKATNTEIFDNGVKTKDMIRLFKEYGLSAKKIDGMTAEELPAYIKARIPVIVLLQAYKDASNKIQYSKDYKDGHYVVAIGYDGDKIIFEDPSSYTRTFLTFTELNERWHAVDDDNEPNPVSEAIVVKGTPKYNSNELKRME